MGKAIKITLAIALAYTLGALIGFQFALTPESPTTLFWAPSGIALGALIFWSRLAVPGIFIGALIVNLILAVPAPGLHTFLPGLATAAASTTSAVVAHVLIRRYASSAPFWTSCIVRFRPTLA